MNKTKLIEQIAQKSQLSKKSSEKALNGCLDAIQETLIKEGKLTLTGFGSFSVTERKERKGHNPQTGVEMTIPASKVVKFKPGKELNDIVAS
jgi:DNA-binding protein HU-beta